MFIWYILLGALVLTGGLLAAVFLLPKWVADSFNHGDECDCNACMRRRMTKWDRLNDKREGKQPRGVINIADSTATEMVSTQELNTHDLVTGQKMQGWYVVNEVVVREYGWTVIISNVRTGAVSWIRISEDRLLVKMWKRRIRYGRKGHVSGL